MTIKVYFFETYSKQGDIEVGFVHAESSEKARDEVNNFFNGDIISCHESDLNDLRCKMWLL